MGAVERDIPTAMELSANGAEQFRLTLRIEKDYRLGAARRFVQIRKSKSRRTPRSDGQTLDACAWSFHPKQQFVDRVTKCESLVRHNNLKGKHPGKQPIGFV